jgi:Ni/Fe-hydrogenase 1 B-type cytochrome subunit
MTTLPREGEYRWVTLWGKPLRAMHWIAALAIVVLAVTGLYIGKPYFMTGGDTSQHFLMGWVRFTHFAAAAALVMTAIVRVYWLFRGNQFERHRALLPLGRKAFKDVALQAKSYLLIRPDEAPRYLGHNPLQQFSYTMLYGVAALQVITGFALYGQAEPGGFFFTTLGWVAPLLGGIQAVRFAHHVLTWVFLIFIPVHIYLAVRADILEHNTAISSMISGGRMVSAGSRFEDE